MEWEFKEILKEKRNNKFKKVKSNCSFRKFFLLIRTTVPQIRNCNQTEKNNYNLKFGNEFYDVRFC